MVEMSEETKTRFQEIFGFEPSSEPDLMILDLRIIKAKLMELATVHQFARESVEGITKKYNTGDSYPIDEIITDRQDLKDRLTREKEAEKAFAEALGTAMDAGYRLAPTAGPDRPIQISDFYPGR